MDSVVARVLRSEGIHHWLNLEHLDAIIFCGTIPGQ